MIDLTGRVSLVTGASRGIGRACALRLAEAGSDVVINYLTSETAAREVGDQIRDMGRRVAIIKADVGEPEDVASMMEFIDEDFGKLDVLVSNAATGGFRPLLTATARHFEATMKTNVMAFVHLVQRAMPLLTRSTGRSKIIALSSHGSHLALPMYGMIGGSKAALESVVRHFSLELGDRGVNVNVVKAGFVDTDSTRQLPGYEEIAEAVRKYRSMTGDRMLMASDVANAVLFLASPLSDMVQGSTLTVDSGAAIHA